MSSTQQGKNLRDKVSRKLQAVYSSGDNRPSVVDMIRQSDEDRLQNLIPIRHARMSASPFAFYRGNAAIMARDLSFCPGTQIAVQAIGDCHLMNFGAFATPERTLVFDANDFDETLPATWEWDLKRLATSFVLAARHQRLKESEAGEMALLVTQSYRNHMHLFSEMNLLDLWYMKFDLEAIRNESKNPQLKAMLSDAITRSQKKTQDKILYKITTGVLGRFEISEQPPLLYHPFDIRKDHEMILNFLDHYGKTLNDDRRWLFQQYEVVDVALKVVGVGSVGTRCYVVLLINKKKEPLFIQVKEARKSILEPYQGPSRYAHNGQRVVEGQRLVQAASDIFLGWSTDPEGRHFYFRQLRDRKLAPDLEHFDKNVLDIYARFCGRMLARAHAKAGDAAMISGYMGKSDQLDLAISQFAKAYADQTEKDYEEFMKAIRAGVLPVEKT